jgi:hypothetical protein
MTEEQRINEEALSHLESILERNISNYALDDTEDLYDEDNNFVVRVLKWSRGDKEWNVVITPFSQIRTASKNIPRDLLMQIFNVLVDTTLDALWKTQDNYDRKNEENRLLRRGILQKD